MSKKIIRNRKPKVVRGRDHTFGNYEFLVVGTEINTKTFLNDVEAGAKQFRRCQLPAKKMDNRVTILEADNPEEGLTAVTYYHALARDHKYEILSKKYAELYGQSRFEDKEFTFNPDTEDPEEEFDEDFEEEDIEEIGDEDDSELARLMGNSTCIPIIPVCDVNNYARDSGEAPLPFFNQLGVGNLPPSVPPYWTNLHDKPVIILINNQADFYLLGDRKPRFLEPFDHLPEIYILFIRASKMQICEEDYYSDPIDEEYFDNEPAEDDVKDPIITKMMLSFTANDINVSCSPEQHAAYRFRLLESWMDEYGFTSDDPRELRTVCDKISRIDPDCVSECMEQTLKLLRSNDENASKLSLEALRHLGLLDLNKATVDDVSLSRLVGMKGVKKDLQTLVDTLKFNRLRKQSGQKCADMHNVFLFLGAPGTAKTTAAKALGQMLRKEKLLPRDRFISLTGAQLKGQYLGQTAPRVASLFRKYDIILFDEAYSLVPGKHERQDIYSEEALAQLASELEEHATDKVVIFAGYGGDDISEKDNRMQEFLDANPGIRSRISYIVNFPSYSVEEMITIIHHIAKERGLKMTHAADEEIKNYYATRINDRTFGNGREARVFVENAERFLAQRFANATVLPKNASTISKREIMKTLDYLRSKDKTNCPYRRYGII